MQYGIDEHIETAFDHSGLDRNQMPKCSFSGQKADYYLGLSSTAQQAHVHIMGAVSSDMVETGINKLLGQGWDDIKWPVVLDMGKKLVYHTFEAYEKGTSAILGWQEARTKF